MDYNKQLFFLEVLEQTAARTAANQDGKDDTLEKIKQELSDPLYTLQKTQSTATRNKQKTQELFWT